jgi:hypothetical protein
VQRARHVRLYALDAWFRNLQGRFAQFCRARGFVYCHFNAVMSQKSTPRSLNSPTGNALRNKNNFQFYRLESGDDFPRPRDDPSKFASGNACGRFFQQAPSPDSSRA